MKEYLKAFIIGSCWFSFVLFFIGFGSIQYEVNKDNCVIKMFDKNTYRTYTILAPLYIGIMSVIAIAIRNYYKISTRKAFIIIGIISALIVSAVITFCRIYNWTPTRYFKQYIKLQLYHFILFSGIIATIYIYLDS